MATLTACAGLGPTAVRRDQADYADALSEASKQQLLLNIVKLRYLDAPALISVNQLVDGYSRSGSFNLGSSVFSDQLELADDIEIGGSASFSENPPRSVERRVRHAGVAPRRYRGRPAH